MKVSFIPYTRVSKVAYAFKSISADLSQCSGSIEKLLTPISLGWPKTIRIFIARASQVQINPTIVDIARESKSFTVQIRISSLLRKAEREKERGGERGRHSWVALVCIDCLHGLCLRFQLVSPIPGPISVSECLLPGVALITQRYVIALKTNDPSIHRSIGMSNVDLSRVQRSSIFGQSSQAGIIAHDPQLPKRSIRRVGRLIKTHFKFIEQMFALKQNVCKMLKETTHTFYFVV